MVHKILIFKLLFIVCVLFSSSNIYSQEVIQGKVNIIDGDTIHIGKNKIRLHAIDAPETKQKCIKNNKEWNCGLQSTEFLLELIVSSKIQCITNGKDKYNRYIAICYLKKLDINKWMVSNGYAIAYKRYSKKYVADEEFAKQNKSGLWRGEFMNPEKWRRISN